MEVLLNVDVVVQGPLLAVMVITGLTVAVAVTVGVVVKVYVDSTVPVDGFHVTPLVPPLFTLQV
jgi:hypothetical protein